MPEKSSKVKLPVPVSLPSLKLKFNKSMYLPLLVTLLVVASFLLGVLFTKVQYLEKGVGTPTTVGTTGDTQPVAPAASPGAPVNVSTGHLPVMGNKNAKVTVIEFADFQCPFCEQWFTQVEPNIVNDYVNAGKVKFAFRHYAFLGQESTDAALASECANEQGKFWEYHDYLYQHQGQENSGTFSKDKLKQFALTLGLNGTQFNDCLDSGKYQKNVAQDQKEGSAAGVNGTPATFINGQMISGAAPYTEFKNLIDKELAK